MEQLACLFAGAVAAPGLVESRPLVRGIPEKAERVIARELKRRGWNEEELLARRKGDPWKVRLAQRLRVETVQSVQWIAQRLSMGSRAYVNHLLWRAGKSINNKN